MDGYKEYMVSRDMTFMDSLKRILSMGLAILFLLLGFTFYGTVALGITAFILSIIMFIITFVVVVPGTDLEFEYLYVDKELTIDKIMAKSKRKTMDVMELDRIEMICPASSYRNDEFKNRNLTITDYSSRKKSDAYETYYVYFEGNRKIVLDLPADFVKMIQNNAPRKVFLD